jgi:RimJ/RimL family protein N-acetyltransferase
MILETERLILRPFRDSDLEPFLAYRSDPEVARYQGWDMPYTAEKAAEFIAEMKNSPPRPPGEWYQLAIELKANQRMIGDCAFCILAEDQRQAEIGYTLSRDYQGSGYGAEAVRRLLGYLFDELQLHRVRANTDAENTASARLLERVGMRREAHHIQSLWFKGRWSSEYWYALLRDEWSEFSG